MKIKVRISDMVNNLDEKHVQDIEPAEDSHVEPSEERIKELAMEKLQAQSRVAASNVAEFGERDTEPSVRVQTDQNEQAAIMREEYKEYTMKKSSIRKLLTVAAVICLVTVTAFAAGGLDYFRSIFGDSADLAGDNIQNLSQYEEAGNYRLAAESLLTDGYKTDLILSLSTIDGKKLDINKGKNDLFNVVLESADGVEEDFSMYSISYNLLDGYSTKSKQYYHVSVAGVNGSADRNAVKMQITLNDDAADITMNIDVTNNMVAKEVAPPAEDFTESNITVEKVQISPMGVLLVGREKEQRGGMLAPDVTAVFKDGSTEELFDAYSFDAAFDDDGVSAGGGGMIVGGGNYLPLVTSTMFQRNPDMSFAMTANYSHIINLDDVVAIRIGEKEYAL